MKNLKTEQILSIVISSAKAYAEKLLDKNFLVVYQDRSDRNTYKYKKVGFRDYNFLHLTGLKTKMSASAFFSAAISNRLSVGQFEVDKAGKCIQKLILLNYVSELLYNKCMIGDFIDSGISIRADYFTGDTRATISLGFRNGNKIDYPVSLYNEDIRKLSSPTNRVIAIYAKRFNSEIYNELTYVHPLYVEKTFIELYPEIKILLQEKDLKSKCGCGD